ncbi:Pho86p CYBJADRAFT_95059 [Cyberlindnera jadinii NRRL Y-1542]|uniref:Uncharacterized protein n=1 Tax=Cyberlindnera jadinii (strain ATCC 18201 / CBS 1600 / BCRC 20928 / JCM 3617 / NBRC 0987 / NRRL Y-1542) TaxID=983966 RepID=A0A1E4S0J4_CYBJN|nr:hypothetical protein CYBJADRAFT_95059 [Cyberlindnera jadinii NRRL Y-1542]ODV72997.1 hypothetical protein CYBJADRAFT_95059 [Cyberlindnera jadinii NRRL Y-1542]
MSQAPTHLQGLMDEDAPPTIHTSSLTPELCEAALNLTIDFQRQKQSVANAAIMKHPITVGTIVSIIAAVSYWKLGWIYKRGGFALIKDSLEEVVGVVVLCTMVISTLLTVITRPTDVIKQRADRIVDESKPVFGVDLKEFAASRSKKFSQETASKADNTKVVIYRDTPIAVISLIDIPEMTNDEKFVTRITGAGVRKVYWKSGIIEDLIDFAVSRSGQLNNSKAPKILVLFEVLSTDAELKKVLIAKKFQKIESRPINDSKLLKLFGVHYEIYGLPLNVTKLSELELIDGKVGSTGSKRKT